MTFITACRMELETRIQEQERRRINDDERLHAEKEKMEDKLQQAKDAKELAERESIALK